VPHLFNADGTKIIPAQSQQVVASADLPQVSKGNADFVIEALQLPERVGIKEVAEQVKEGEKNKIRQHEKPLVTLLPKPENESVFFIGKSTVQYNFPIDDKNKLKPTNSTNFQKMSTVSVFNQLQHFNNQQQQPSLSLPSFSQINNAAAELNNNNNNNNNNNSNNNNSNNNKKI